MRNYATLSSLAFVTWQLACGQGNSTSRSSQGVAEQQQAAVTTQDTSRNAQASVIDSQAIRFMPMMWMHLDSMSRWSPAQMQQMMAAHQQMAGRMMQMMGPIGMMGGPGMMGRGMGMGPGSPWMTLRDSIQRDLTTMPGLSGKDLTAMREAHIDRMRRMMVLGMGMMPGGAWGSMPGGCGMLDSMGHMSGQRMQWMWGMHSQMSGQMISAMMANMRARGITPSAEWLTLRDSVRKDMTELPKLQGDSLRARMQAHADRMQRLMGLQAQAMGMPMGPMGMGCQR